MLTTKFLIFVIHSLPASFWTESLQKGFEDELKIMKLKYEINTIYLQDEHQDQLLQSIDKKKPSIILLVNEPNEDSIIDKIMARKIPIFFVSIIKQSSDVKWIKPEWRKYQTGVFGTFNAAASLKILKKIVPVKSIGIIATSNKTITNLALLSQAQINREYPDVKVEIAFENDFDMWKTKAKKVAKNNDAFIPLLPYDVKRKNGEVLKQSDWPEIGAFLRKEVHKPMLAVGTMKIGGIDRFLGLVIEPEKLGLQAASQVYRYTIKKIPIEQIPMEEPIFHDLQIKKSEILRLNIKIPEEISSIATIF